MNVQDSGDSPEILSNSLARVAVLEAELRAKEEALQRTITELDRLERSQGWDGQRYTES
jgi:hypothetical protein